MWPFRLVMQGMSSTRWREVRILYLLGIEPGAQLRMRGKTERENSNRSTHKAVVLLEVDKSVKAALCGGNYLSFQCH